MTLALRLREAGCDTTLIEAAATPGGLVQSQAIGGYTWDRFYHVTLLSDQHLHGLLEELGLSALLRWGTTRTGFFTDGRLRSLSNSLEFLAFPALSLVDKLRLAATVALRLAHTRLAPAGTDSRGRMAPPLVGGTDAGAYLASPAQEQAGRELPGHQRRLHLGDHRPHVCRAPDRPQARDVRLRRWRL